MPVFNKAGLTRQCLETIRPTLEGAGDGEIIVVDNASSDDTPEMLEEFPWVRVIRNDVNRGYSGANNQGAAAARGEFLVLLNNDIVAHPGWLAAMLACARDPGVGAVGAKLLFPDGTLQHAGVWTTAYRFGSSGFGASHRFYRYPSEYPPANERTAALDVVTGACLVTPRALFAELGGLDEGFWNGNEDVDYCFRVVERGLRVVYEPKAVLTHFESQSGPQRYRKVSHNIQRLTRRWNGRVRFDRNAGEIARGRLFREKRTPAGGHSFVELATPATTVLVHGTAEQIAEALARPSLEANAAPIARVVALDPADPVGAARAEMEIRGDRYVALVDARSELVPNWLDELVRQCEFSLNVGAATYAPELPLGEDVSPIAADARCTLLSLRQFPQHLRLGDFPTLDEAVADLLVRAIDERVVTRGAGAALGVLPPASGGSEFVRVDPAFVESRLAARPRATPLVSILMLSWNAPEYTKLALESIRAHTRPPYEVVIVDNGSRAETTDWLRTLEDVRVIYNPSNRGFAGGSNQALAAASGDYLVLLNNDTIVTDGWLDGLLDAFERIPALGISAVRSNRVAGVQMLSDAKYPDLDAMHEYAARRRIRYRRHGMLIDRAIGLCLCLPRRVLDEVGGIDERFGVGNFEDDDFCLRVRAAGYRIYVCDDVFIHHFGSQTFAANKVDYRATMSDNWEKFSAKWGLKKIDGVDGYESSAAYRRGFDRARHFVPLPDPFAGTIAQAAPVEASERAYEVAFVAVVADERGWHDTGAFVRRYVRALAAADPVVLAIAATGDPDAATIGARIEKILEREGVDPALAPDVVVSDETDPAAWSDDLPWAERVLVADVADASPSALRRRYGSGSR